MYLYLQLHFWFILVRLLKHSCSLCTKASSALEVLRKCAIQIYYLLTYLLTYLLKEKLPLRPFRSEMKKVLPQHFTPCIVDVHPYKNILLPCYRVPQKTVKFVKRKTEGSAIICAHRIGEMPVSHAIFLNVLGAFYRL